MIGAASLRARDWLVEIIILLAAVLILLRAPLFNGLAGLFLLFLAPGYQTLRWLGIYPSSPTPSGRQSTVTSLSLSAALSLALSPLLIYWTSLLTGYNPVSAVLALTGFSLLAGLLAREFPTQNPAIIGPLFQQPRHRRIFAGLAALLTLMIVLPYLQIRIDGALFEPSLNDWPKHYTVTWLIEESGLPPRHLLYPPWQDRPFVYYYFFHVSVASLRLFSGQTLSILNAFVITAVIAALALLGNMALLARRLLGRERPALLSLLFLTLIGGLDLIPLLAQGAANVLARGPSLENALVSLGADGWVDCWNGRISSLYTTAVWTPHHLSAALIFLLGLVLLNLLGRSRRLLILLPLLLFSLIGHSVYVAVPALTSLVIFALVSLARTGRTKGWGQASKDFGGWIAAASGFFLLSLPYLADLWATRGIETSGLSLHVARNGASWLEGALFSQLLGDDWWARLLDAPLFYAIELGALLILGLLGWHRFQKQRLKAGRPRESLDLLLLSGSAALILSLVVASRGAVTQATCNDFRMRSVLLLQLALAAFAGLGLDWMLARRRDLAGRLLLSLILLGAVATTWDFVGRSFGRFVLNYNVPAPAMAAYEAVRSQTPPDAIVQGDPGNLIFRDRPLHLYSQRNARIDMGMYPLLHVPIDQFGADVRSLVTAWTAPDAKTASTLLHQLQIDYIFIGPEERRMYSAYTDLSQFEDTRYFELVYDSDGYQFYRVL